MKKISGVYKIVNTITGDFYIGSSKNVKSRWASHKWPSMWKKYPNNPLYLDFQKYGLDYFEFEVLAEVEIGQLKEKEQWFIETLKPTYNNYNAKGLDVERCKEYQKSDKYKEYHKSNKWKETHRKSNNKYNNQLCCYNGETIALNTLTMRFYRAGIENPTKEAKKYLLNNNIFKNK